MIKERLMFEMKRYNKKALLALPLSAALVMAACGDGNGNDNNVDEGANNDGNPAGENNGEDEDGMAGGLLEEEEEGEADIAEAIDLDADPDEPIATVNGEEIYMEALQGQMEQYEMMMAQQGMDLEDEENAELVAQIQQDALNQLVDQEILFQEAEAQDIEASEEEVEAELEQIQAQFESEDEFQEALESQGYTTEELEDEIRDFIKVQELQTMNHLEDDAYEISEDEAREHYEQMAAQNPEIGEFEDVQAELESELMMEQYIDDLRDQADVEILV